MLLALAGVGHAQPPESAVDWPPASLAVCDQLVAREPDNIRSYYCYSAVVRAGRASRDVASSRISALLARRPPSPHALYVRALMMADSADPATEKAYLDAIAAYDASGDPRGRVRARVYLSTFRSITGRERDAEPLVEAERIARDSGDAQLQALVSVDQAWAAYRATDYGKAQRLLEAVEAVVRGPAATDLQVKWLSGRGAVAWALGDQDRARDTYLEELALHRRTGNTFDEGITLSNLALLAQGDERARYAREALAVSRRLGNHPGEVAAMSMLSTALPEAEALTVLRDAVGVARRAGDRDSLSNVLRLVATRQLSSDRVAAIAAIDEAIEVSRTLGDRNELVRNLTIRSTLWWRTGPRDRARQASLEVLDAVESLRNLQPEDRVRAQRFAQWRSAYYRASGHLLAGHLNDGAVAAGERDEAFMIGERLRARLLLDRLDASRAVVPVRADEALLQRRRAVLDRISRTNRELAAPGLAPAARTRLVAELIVAEREEAEARAALAKASPTFAMVRQPTLANLADIQRTLAVDEALVAFQLYPLNDGDGAYGAWRWVITQREVDVRPVSQVQELQGAVQIFLGLTTSTEARAADAAAQVYRRVFDDALDRLPAEIRRLVIVPDDALFQVPFDALRASATGPPLAQRFAMSLAPSATTWWRLRSAPHSQASQSALVYADPQGRSAWPTLAPGGVSSATRADGSLEPLPGARREGAGAARLLPGAVRLLAGADATETAFKGERIADYRILHFAAHAVLDASRPERTAVLLAPSNDDDGMLQVREIVDLRLDGQAVVLSACQSANGLLVPAEGLFGLSHAFVLAGARVVVANLWPVRDRDAADFVALMYEGIAEGLTIRDAVHRARLTSIARGRPVSAWAGMVVLGDGDVVLVSGRPWLRWYHATALALVVVALLAWSVGRRRQPAATA